MKQKLHYSSGLILCEFDDYDGIIYYKDGSIACEWHTNDIGMTTGKSVHQNGKLACSWMSYQRQYSRDGQSWYEDGKVACQWSSGKHGDFSRTWDRFGDEDIPSCGSEIELSDHIRFITGHQTKTGVDFYVTQNVDSNDTVFIQA